MTTYPSDLKSDRWQPEMNSAYGEHVAANIRATCKHPGKRKNGDCRICGQTPTLDEDFDQGTWT